MEITYVYQNTESGLYTVGYYNPTGKWVPESDHDSSEAAASRVHFLNGGTEQELLRALQFLLPMAESYLKNAPTHPDNAKLETARDALRKMASERRVGRG